MVFMDLFWRRLGGGQGGRPVVLLDRLLEGECGMGKVLEGQVLRTQWGRGGKERDKSSSVLGKRRPVVCQVLTVSWCQNLEGGWEDISLHITPCSDGQDLGKQGRRPWNIYNKPVLQVSTFTMCTYKGLLRKTGLVMNTSLEDFCYHSPLKFIIELWDVGEYHGERASSMLLN